MPHPQIGASLDALDTPAMLIDLTLMEANIARLMERLRGSHVHVRPHLKTVKSTVERAASGQFTREAIAVVRNDVFARFCEERGDAETAALYRERIQPDEQHHHELGRRLLLRYAISDDAQAKARAAAAGTLQVAEEVQELARLKMGVCRAPGC